MRIFIFTTVSILTKTEGGSFLDEMTKFKNGLTERPQTYRKIEITDGGSFGSCCGREISATIMTLEDAKKHCQDLNKKLAETVLN